MVGQFILHMPLYPGRCPFLPAAAGRNETVKIG